MPIIKKVHTDIPDNLQYKDDIFARDIYGDLGRVNPDNPTWVAHKNNHIVFLKLVRGNYSLTWISDNFKGFMFPTGNLYMSSRITSPSSLYTKIASETSLANINAIVWSGSGSLDLCAFAKRHCRRGFNEYDEIHLCVLDITTGKMYSSLQNTSVIPDWSQEDYMLYYVYNNETNNEPLKNNKVLYDMNIGGYRNIIITALFYDEDGTEYLDKFNILQCRLITDYVYINEFSIINDEIPAWGGSIGPSDVTKLDYTIYYTNGYSVRNNKGIVTYTSVSANSKGTVESGLTPVNKFKVTVASELDPDIEATAEIQIYLQKNSSTLIYYTEDTKNITLTLNPKTFVYLGGYVDHSASRSYDVLGNFLYTSKSIDHDVLLEQGKTQDITAFIEGDTFNIPFRYKTNSTQTFEYNYLVKYDDAIAMDKVILTVGIIDSENPNATNVYPIYIDITSFKVNEIAPKSGWTSKNVTDITTLSYKIYWSDGSETTTGGNVSYNPTSVTIPETSIYGEGTIYTGVIVNVEVTLDEFNLLAEAFDEIRQYKSTES